MGIYDKIDITGNGLLTLIPQRAPVVMIDKLILADDMSARTSLTVRSDNIFCDGERLLEPGLIENIAQTAAANMGYRCKLKEEATPLGFIGAITDLTISTLPKLGTTITTTIEIEHEIFDATIISGRISSCDAEIARCKMKVFTINTKE